MPLTTRSALRAVAIAVGLLLTIASAPALADVSSCSAPTMTQPFSSWGDDNWYALVPGQDAGNFTGDGWVLGNGARLVTATVRGGASATVLELPSGGWATSPAMCVDSTYQSARAMLRSAYGSPSVDATVSYQYAWGGWSSPQDMGQTYAGYGWRPSAVLSLSPLGSGWRMARFTLWGGGYYSAAQLYDFYIDPYGRG
jgi:hypothetical protein